ncbi:MAG: hypothetical protein ABJA93_08755 [Sporichthyaceae bacterium]
MSWCWLALVEEITDGEVLAQAAVTAAGGARAGVLAAWPAGRKPRAEAVRADARVVDPSGGPATVSLVLLPRDRSPIFDDPAVSGALRAVLAAPPPDAVTTLVRDASHFAGALTVRRDRLHLLRDDPFARIGRARLLHVASGLLAVRPPVPGPVIQRYSGQPWPAAGFN